MDEGPGTLLLSEYTEYGVIQAARMTGNWDFKHRKLYLLLLSNRPSYLNMKVTSWQVRFLFIDTFSML